MALQPLRDANILQDFTVWVKGNGKIGTCPGFQLPEINVQTEEFRGGGMDGSVDIPMGIEKIEFDFDLHTWDVDIFKSLGFGPRLQNVQIQFRGYMLTPDGGEKGVYVDTVSLIKSVKPGKVEAGGKVEINVSCTAHYYKHRVDSDVITEIDLFNKVYKIGGLDVHTRAKSILGFNGTGTI